MRYETAQGRVLTWAIETHVVDHCNLRCAHCCTLSPHLAPWAVEPAVLRQDLDRAAQALRPLVFKVTGGEPLLHPRLGDLLQAIRDARISDTLSITTNGHLLSRVEDHVLRLADRLTLSWYPSAPLSTPILAAIAARCRRLGIVLNVKTCAEFQHIDAPAPHDPAAARAVYDVCWLRNRCHLLYRGRFYTCTRPPHLAQLAGADPVAPGDGVPLDAPDLASAILGYLERGEPLRACGLCLGARGAMEPHRQDPRAARLFASRH